jgi:hypothetical protein
MLRHFAQPIGRLAGIESVPRIRTIHRRVALALRGAGVAGCAAVLAACGGGQASTASTTRSERSRTATTRRRHAALVPVALRYRRLYSLPAAVQDPATGSLGAGRFVLLGGIDAQGASTDGIVVAGLEGAVDTATLPNPQHDAQAAVLGGSAYVFGGGQFSQYDHILGFDPASGSVRAAGTLPSAASDVAVTGLDGTAYVVGGFDGSNWLDTIVAWRPGGAALVIAHLPVAVRYAATTAVGRQIVIVGGSTPSGATDAIYAFSPATGRVRRVGTLPHPLTHASAATLGGIVYIVGGRGDSVDSQTADVWGLDLARGAVRHVGSLPQGLSDTGVAAVDGRIIVAGGRASSGAQAAVGELVPR